MVNEKQTKRERNIKSKLMAAIAMLLVSSIMMVSTTYAWFTLSTAPEVTGITTNIASNGNLEIALSPASGVGAEVGNATTGMGVLAKNLTWGNLVDMSSETYGLGELTLAPAQLYVNVNGNINSLGENVLSTPTYGADGRISGLTANAFIGSKYQGSKDYTMPGETKVTGEDGSETVTKNPHVYGVRAVGTTSGLSAQASKLREARATMTAQISAAIGAASKSLTETGAALAEMMVNHAMASGTDGNDYGKYLPALNTLIGKLEESVVNIDEALKAYLAAAATTLSDETIFNTAITQIGNLNIGDLTVSENNELTIAGQTFKVPAEFKTAVAARKTIATKIDAAQTAYEGAVGETSWEKVSPVLNCLLNTNSSAVTINGKKMSEIMGMGDSMYNFAINMLQDATIELGDGSGLYYDMAEITGNIIAVLNGVMIDEIKYGQINMTNVEMKKVTIKTALPTSHNPYLPSLLAQTSGITAANASGAATRIDTNYGYIVDLMVRTNAADTKLMLQTEGAQRVYGESTSEATMGMGTSFSFKTYNEKQVTSLQNLLTSIRVVFFDPTNGANTIMGLARVVDAPVITPVVIGTETEYTITGELELCSLSSATTDAQGNVTYTDLTGTGVCVAGAKLTDPDPTTPNLNENAALCNLTQNVPQAVSAMVYLDGENVTSADVLADQNVTGALNLQFSSSASLAPMENSDLMNMVAYKVTKGVGVTGTNKALKGAPYTFSIATGNKLKAITVNGADLTTLPTKQADGTYMIPAESIIGDIVIVTEKDASPIELTSVEIAGDNTSGINVKSAKTINGKIEIVLEGYTTGTVAVKVAGKDATATVSGSTVTCDIPEGVTMAANTAVTVTITGITG